MTLAKSEGRLTSSRVSIPCMERSVKGFDRGLWDSGRSRIGGPVTRTQDPLPAHVDIGGAVRLTAEADDCACRRHDRPDDGMIPHKRGPACRIALREALPWPPQHESTRSVNHASAGTAPCRLLIWVRDRLVPRRPSAPAPGHRFRRRRAGVLLAPTGNRHA